MLAVSFWYLARSHLQQQNKFVKTMRWKQKPILVIYYQDMTHISELYPQTKALSLLYLYKIESQNLERGVRIVGHGEALTVIQAN